MISKQHHLNQAGSNKTLNYSCGEITQRFPHVNKFTQERNQMCSSLSISYTFVEFTLMCSCHDCTKKVAHQQPYNCLGRSPFMPSSSLHKATIPRLKRVIFDLRESDADTRK